MLLDLDWFQSLIGILKTGDGLKQYKDILMFQSLIGILKTCK